MRSFSFYWFIWRSVDKLTCKCICDLVLWEAIRKQCLPGDLQSFPCPVSEYSTLSLCLKRWTLAPEQQSIFPERLWRKVHSAFLCKPSSVAWFLLHLCLPAMQHGVGCGGSCREQLGWGCGSGAVLLRGCCWEWAVLCHWGSHSDSMCCLALSCVSGLLSADAAPWKPFWGYCGL